MVPKRTEQNQAPKDISPKLAVQLVVFEEASDTVG